MENPPESLVNEKNQQLADFLNKGYSVWQIQTNGKHTHREFAKWLGVTPQQLGHYFKGTRNPNIKTAGKIAEKLGQKIFTILDFKPSDEDLDYIVENWLSIPQPKRDEIMKIIKKEVRPSDEYVIYKDGKRYVYRIQEIQFEDQ